MGQQQYTIAMQGLGKKEQVFFTSILQIVQSKLDVSWNLSETAADVVLVDLDASVGEQFWRNNPTPIKIAYARHNTLQAEWFLAKPIRVQALIQLLNALTALQMNTLARATTPARSAIPTPTPKVAEPTPTLVATTPDSVHFNPAAHLLGLLQAAQQQTYITEFRCASLPTIYIVPQEQQGYVQAIDMQQLSQAHKILCAAYAEHVEQKIVDMDNLRQVVAEQNLKAYPIETLLWLSTLYASRGQLIVGLYAQSGFKLKRWPNFANLPHQSIHMNLAAFMVKNFATIEMIVKKTYVPAPNVINFVNACQVLNLLQVETQVMPVVLQQDEVTAPKRRLFQSILQRLTVFNNG